MWAPSAATALALAKKYLCPEISDITEGVGRWKGGETEFADPDVEPTQASKKIEEFYGREDDTAGNQRSGKY